MDDYVQYADCARAIATGATDTTGTTTTTTRGRHWCCRTFVVVAARGEQWRTPTTPTPTSRPVLRGTGCDGACALAPRRPFVFCGEANLHGGFFVRCRAAVLLPDFAPFRSRRRTVDAARSASSTAARSRRIELPSLELLFSSLVSLLLAHYRRRDVSNS
mmetsp:Transcript_30059/g.91981  ORF Transcript_30059/g.91981 Transcript_30059/m.91981 type:complete len:160 (-) Transcript_30059:101-580(-)